MHTAEKRASVSNGKLRLKTSQIRPLTFVVAEAMEAPTDGCSQLCPAPPDTYKRCPSCSLYCSAWCA